MRVCVCARVRLCACAFVRICSMSRDRVIAEIEAVRSAAAQYDHEACVLKSKIVAALGLDSAASTRSMWIRYGDIKEDLMSPEEISNAIHEVDELFKRKKAISAKLPRLYSDLLATPDAPAHPHQHPHQHPHVKKDPLAKSSAIVLDLTSDD